MIIFLKITSKFDKISPGFLVESEKTILKLMWKLQVTRVTNFFFLKNKKVGGLTLSDFKTYYNIKQQ